MYTLNQKYIDNLLVLLLVFTGGGLLFVFNRNLMYYFFLALLSGAIVINASELKRSLTNSIIFTFLTISSLFIINFLFASSEQSLDKYLYYFTVIISSILFYVHFKNNRGNHIFLLRLNFILKIIFIHSLLNFLALNFVEIKGCFGSLVFYKFI